MTPQDTSEPYPVKLNGLDPLGPVLRVLRPQVPHTVINADVQSALVKLVGLWVGEENKGEMVNTQSLKKIH